MNWPGDFINKVICGDCLEVMREMPDECVDLTITSPPYDNLRDYDSYTFNFKRIAEQLFRVTKVGGVVVWIIGDATIDGSETGTSFKQALYFKDIGFSLYDTMIYHKISIPKNHARYEQEFEYMFILARGKIKTFNPIMIKNKQAGRKDPKSTFRHGGTSTGKMHTPQSVKKERIEGNVWFYEVGFMLSSKDNIAFNHPAIFPDKLALDHVISWSDEDNVILDPFLGSGTTAKACKLLHRKFIGIEINPEYCKIAEERLAQGVL